MTLVLYIHSAVGFVLLWSCFAVFAFYLNNQTFWGWRRTIVGHGVYADKGFGAGDGPFIPQADRLMPGELYRSKWSTVGGLSVMRNIAGTPPPLGMPNGRSPHMHSEEDGQETSRSDEGERLTSTGSSSEEMEITTDASAGAQIS